MNTTDTKTEQETKSLIEMFEKELEKAQDINEMLMLTEIVSDVKSHYNKGV
jgi:hypothetical protein